MREEFSCDSMWVYPKLSDKDTPNDPNGDMIWKVNFPTPFKSMGIPGSDLLEVPTIYKAYFSGLCKGISVEHMTKNMVQYLHFRILKFTNYGSSW
jgi:hypothetical protein